MSVWFLILKCCVAGEGKEAGGASTFLGKLLPRPSSLPDPWLGPGKGILHVLPSWGWPVTKGLVAEAGGNGATKRKVLTADASISSSSTVPFVRMALGSLCVLSLAVTGRLSESIKSLNPLEVSGRPSVWPALDSPGDGRSVPGGATGSRGSSSGGGKGAAKGDQCEPSSKSESLPRTIKQTVL